MILYTLNRNEEIVGILSNEGDNNFLSSAILKEEENGGNTFDFEVSSLSSEVEHIKEENYVLFKDLTKEWHMFIIKEIEELHNEQTVKSVYCESANQELLDSIYEGEMKGAKGTAREFLMLALQNTRWEIGSLDNTTSMIFPYETKNKSVLEVVHLIRQAFGLKAKFRVDVTGNKITNRLVDLKEQLGSNLGKRFEFTKDIVEVKRTVSTTDLKTAIIPVGGTPEPEEDSDSELKDNFQNEEKQPIDITGVAWKKPTNPIDKPLGQNYIEIPEATAQWGYKSPDGEMLPRVTYYEFTDITEPEELMAEAYERLKKISKPVTNYTLNVVDLFALTGDEELSFESVKLGDYVTVIDKEFNPPIKLRTSIVRREVDLLEPENTVIELGSFIRNLVDSESAIQLEDKIQSAVGGTLDRLESMVTDVSGNFDKFQKEYSSNEIDTNMIRNSDFRNNLKYYEARGTYNLWDLYDIPYFDTGVSLGVGTSEVIQMIEGEEAKSLLNNNVTFSAFVKGTGQLMIGIHYKDNATQSKQVYYNSSTFNSNGKWKRYSLSTALKPPADFGSLQGISVRFKTTAQQKSYVTGYMLNYGVVAGKYKKHTSDKYGKGVYDQVREVSNTAFHSGNGYVYLEEEDGLWVYDKPANGNPSKMTALKGGMLGIGNWNNQTQKWDIATFIDGKQVNASCINTGTLNADLVKTGTIQSLDKTVQININNGAFKIGGQNGKAVQITNDYVRTNHSNGSYSQMSSEGFYRYNSGTKKEYHHLATVIGFTASGTPESDITVQLPDEFKGKEFTAQAVLSDTYTDSWNYGEPWVLQRMVVYVTGKDYDNARVSIRGYRTDKNYSTGAYRHHVVAGMLIVIA